MEQPVSWRLQFKIPEDDANLTLSDAIVSGRISEAEYIAWAKTAFNLPVVTDTYFSIPEDPIYWESICHLFSWTPDLFPLTEWDGVMVIACVEPPREFRLSRQHQFVLVPPKHLHALWLKLNPDSKIVTSAPVQSAKPPAPAAPPARPTDLFSQLSEQLAGLNSVDETDSSSGDGDSETPVESEIEMPAGMLPLGDFDLKIPKSMKSVAEPVFSSGAPTEPASQIVIPIALTSATPLPIAMPPPIAMGPAPTLEHAAAALAAVPPRLPKNTENSSVPGTISTDMSAEVEIVPESEFSDEFSHTRIVLAEGDTRPILFCENIEEISVQSLRHLVRSFKSAMVLIREKDGIIPWQWTTGLASPLNKSVKLISPQSPSIFSIVCRTKLPFHGGIRPSEENNRIFAAFGDGKLPVHATVVPVVVEGRLVAMLMGLNDELMDYRYILPSVEKLAQEVATQVVKFRNERAA